MSRVNVYIYPAEDDYASSAVFAGHFDADTAERWSDADYDGNGSGGTGRGQAVYLTKGSKWVLSTWSRWQGDEDRFEYISADVARDWLLRNHEDEAVARHFGPVPEEEDRRPGRPAIGEAVSVRLGSELLAMVDGYARERSITRAEAIRRLTQDAVTRVRAASATSLSPQINR